MKQKESRLIKAQSWLKERIQKVLVNYTLFYKKGSAVALSGSTPATIKPVIVVVGREHYQIIEKTYPITKRSAVKKIAAREYANPQLQQIRIGPIDNSKRKVIIVRYDEYISSILPKSARLVIPEQFLVINQQVDSSIEYQLNGYTYWFAKRGLDTVGSESGGLIRSREAFELAIGGSSNTQWQHLTFDDYRKYLSRRLVNIRNYWSTDNFITRQSKPFDWQILVPSFISGFVVMVLYLAVSTLFLNSQADQAKAKALELSSEAASVFDQQSELESMHKKAERYTDILQRQSMDMRVWLVLGQITRDDAKIYRLAYSPNVGFIVEGESKNATDVLAQVRASRLTRDAGFNSPTVETQGVERFSINLSLRPEVSSD